MNPQSKHYMNPQDNPYTYGRRPAPAANPRTSGARLPVYDPAAKLTDFQSRRGKLVGCHLTIGNERRANILAFIAAYILEYKMAPVIREIGAAVGLASSSTVHCHLKTLREMGKIDYKRGVPRSIVLMDQAPDLSGPDLLGYLVHYCNTYPNDPNSPKVRAALKLDEQEVRDAA